MQRHWSTIAGLPVISSNEEQLLGRLRAVFVHPETGQILAFLVGWTHVIIPRDIQKWEKERVWVCDSEDLLAPKDILRIQELGMRRTLINGKKVLSRKGKRLGHLKDFSFDPATDHLTSLSVSKNFLFLEWAHRKVSAKDIQEITDKAIVLNIETQQKEKVTKPATLSIAT